MGLHLREQLDQVEEYLHELSALEGRFDVKRLCRCGEEHRLSHHVCDLVSDVENGHNHNNHLHTLCDSLLSHSIFVCTPFLGLGLGKDQIYLDCDSDIADIYVCELSGKYVLVKIDAYICGVTPGVRASLVIWFSVTFNLLAIVSIVLPRSSVSLHTRERYQRKELATIEKCHSHERLNE